MNKDKILEIIFFKSEVFYKECIMTRSPILKMYIDKNIIKVRILI